MGNLLWSLLVSAAFAAPATAAVTFVDIVPDQFVTVPGAGPGLISQFDIDFNGDGGREVRVFVSASSTTGFNVQPVVGTRIMSLPVNISDHFAYPVVAGNHVGLIPLGSSSWVFDSTPGSNLCACVDIGCVGFFANGFIGYVGIEFNLPDGIHYGVIEIEGLLGNGRVRSYAWETTPGVAITAGVPEPKRIGLVVLAILFGLRRRKRLKTGCVATL